MPDQPLEVRLLYGNERAVEGGEAEYQGEVYRVVRRDRQHEKHEQKSVAAELEQYSSEHHAACCGRLRVRVRQPAVEGKRWYLDQECNKKERKGQKLRALWY
jgi:hypothetical protein